jgi:hypothetical protein
MRQDEANALNLLLIFYLVLCKKKDPQNKRTLAYNVELKVALE